MTKKLLCLLAGALFCISTVHATTLSCSETNTGTGDPGVFLTGGTNAAFSGVVFTCDAPVVPLGDTLSSVTIDISNSFAGAIEGQTNTIDFTYTLGGFSGVTGLTLSNTSGPTTGNGGTSSDVNEVVSEAPVSPVQCTAVDDMNVSCTELTPAVLSFTITGASNWVTGGLTTGGSDEFSVTGSYVLSTATTPEPASLMMIGGGLAGLAMLARRKRKV